MRICLSSDWHLRFKPPEGRVDDFFEVQKGKVDQLIAIAHDHECTAILQAGDMFDSAEGSNAVLSHYLGELIFSCPVVFTVCGQHDSYMRNRATGRTALDVAEATDAVHILGPKPVKIHPGEDDEVNVYGASWGEGIPPVCDSSAHNVLVAHAPVYASPIYPGHEPVGPAAFAAKCEGYDLILLGDAHTGFFCDDEANNRLVVSTGCLVRLTRAESDLGNRPHVLIYDTNTRGIKRIDLDIKPAAEVFDLSDKAADAPDLKTVAELIDSLRRDRTERSSFEARLETLLESGEVSEFAAEFMRKALAETEEK